MKVIAVYGSSMTQPGSQDYHNAHLLGHTLAENGYAVISGGYGGIMAAVSEGCAEANGHVIGVTTKRLETLRGTKPNQWVSEEISYERLRERMMHLITEPDGYVVMPGGLGTLAELVVVWELIRTGDLPERPIILYGDYWPNLLKLMQNMPYFPATVWDLLQVAESAQAVITQLQQNESTQNNE